MLLVLQSHGTSSDVASTLDRSGCGAGRRTRLRHLTLVRLRLTSFWLNGLQRSGGPKKLRVQRGGPDRTASSLRGWSFGALFALTRRSSGEKVELGVILCYEMSCMFVALKSTV